jgi:phytoene synthase
MVTVGLPAIAHCRDVLAAGSKSFALAARLLSPPAADRAAVLYAWCRRADDAVDLVPPAHAPVAVARVRAELAACYGAAAVDEPALAAFQRVCAEIRLPRAYPDALVEGLAMDARGAAYHTLDDLYGYAHRVAGVVGLMMCHALGVRDDRALPYAAHLGIAMQLTNICRDVGEDWQRGRLYLPDDLLADAGASGLRARLGEPIAAFPHAAIARAVERLLAIADGLYASGARGLAALPWRAGLAVRAARLIYAAIGRQLARRGYDALAGRAVVPRWRKRWLAVVATVQQLAAAPVHAITMRHRPARLPGRTVRFPDDVFPR